MKKHRLLSTILSLAMMSLSVPGAAAASPIISAPPRLMISELQTGGITDQAAEDGQMEFVELYNPNASPLDLAGWHLEYLSASNDGSVAPTRILVDLSGSIAPTSFKIASYKGYIANADFTFTGTTSASSGSLAKSGGHVRITDSQGIVIDLVTWGTGVSIGSWWKAPEIPAGMSVQRILPGELTYGTGLSFAAPTTRMTPYSGTRSFPPVPDEPAPVTNQCIGIELSEILPNPTGSDTGHEYVEIHNPIETAVPLKGCSIRLGTSGTPFVLPDISLDAGGYRAFYDDETGITLPNATAQTVWLITATNEQGILYANDLADDTAWALIDAHWQPTKNATPNAANALPVLVAPEASSPPVSQNVTSLPCGVGKERNPATNRCRTIPVANVVTACKEGQERNPETNRCRSIAAASSIPVACKVGQERNADTNRCRSVLAATNEPKPCPTGQERNAQTNRCRKITASGTKNLSKVQDVAAKSAASNYRWWLAGLVIIGAFGYGVYEWRTDIASGLQRITNKLLTKKQLHQPRVRTGKKP